MSKAALVTGGSHGIGYACAARLLRDGYSVLICSRHRDQVEEAAERLHAETGGTVKGIEADTGIPEDDERLVATCIAEFGGINAVINNAGIYTPVPFLEFTAEKWDRTLEVNLRGPMLISVAAARWMKDNGGGRIVHIASTNGHASENEFAHYNASKAALMSLAKSMALELSQYDIMVNCIAPGWILTPLSEPWVGDLTETMLKRISPLKRVGRPEEIAEMAAFLCRPEVGYVTGTTINVDGGMMAILASPFD